MLLPLFMVAVLAVVQVGLIVRDQVLLVHAVREGARAAVVADAAGEAGPAAATATGLDAGRLRVSATASGDVLEVTGRYRSPVVLPLLRRLVGEVDLDATVVMRREDTWS